MNIRYRTTATATQIAVQCVLFLFAILIIATTQFLGYSIPEMLIVVVFLVAFCLLRDYQIIPVLAMVFMLSIWLPYTLITVSAAVIIVLKDRGIKSITLDIFFILLFILIQLVSVVLENQDIVIYLKTGLSLLAQVYLFASIKTRTEAKFFAHMIAIGYIILSLFTLVLVIRSVGLTAVIMQFRLGSTTLARWLPKHVTIPNENNLARYSALTTAALLLLRTKKEVHPALLYPSLILAAIVLLLTQSRSGIALLFLTYVLFFFLATTGNSARKVKALLIWLVGLTIVAFLVSRWLPNLTSTIMMRFQDEDLSNGRIDNFIFYHNIWKSKLSWLLFGFGQQNVSARFSRYNDVHSALQAYFVYYGISGAFCFLVFLFLYVKKIASKLAPSAPKAVWIPFIIACIGKLFGAMDTTELLVAVSLATVYIYERPCSMSAPASQPIIANTPDPNAQPPEPGQTTV